ncbi:WxL domain-containing protein, partial [Carnobacterium maltaromaticum]|uniref:WxL domain-containing protein n=1 Tax=Carnobacterium maltaromaticum TaxID=2751 RepID=UPI00295F3032
VTHQDGSVADDAQVNDILHYKIIYRTPYKQADTKYTTISINSDITELTNYTKDSTNLVAHTESGKLLAVPTIVGTTLSLNDSSGTIAANETIIVEFDVTVDAGKVSDGTVIKNSATAEMTFSDNFKTVGLQSNLVETRIKGVLEFISAPKELNFGNDLKISTKDQAYPIQNKDEGLIVQDSRGTGNQWSMKAVLLKELTSESGHKLTDSLRYYNQGKELAFTVGNSIPIRDQKTADNQPVEISNDWKNIQEGPVLKVKAGQPYNEKYTGAIQWTLQSVPGNE